jgi:phosphatidylglycerophosphatase GEP4
MQSVNVAGVSLFAGMAFTSSKALAIPHVEVPDIRWVDWRALKRAGFKACVFDKDNTLTAPYETTVEPRVSNALTECIAVFGAENVAVLSNSAGLKQFDPTGAVADAMEASLGIGFLRHSSKKPSGSCVALEERFKCAPKDMVMLGDRYLTDVVYGNRHGMFTVRCAPFTDAGESASIRAAKTIEEIAVAWWRKPDGSKKPERCPGKKPHENVPEGKDASHFVASPGVW